MPIVADAKATYRFAILSDAVNAMSRRNLIRTAATHRLIARRSVRRRKRSATPGNPPSAHGPWLKNGFRYAWDGTDRSAVSGIMPNGRRNTAAAFEVGGTIYKRDRRGKRRRYKLRPFPVLGPALTNTIPRVPDIWRGTLRS